MPEGPQAADRGRIVPPGAVPPGADLALAAAGAGLLAVARALGRDDAAGAEAAFRGAVAGQARLILNGRDAGGAGDLPVLVADLPDGAAPGPRGAVLSLHAGAPGPAPLAAGVAVWGARLDVAIAVGSTVWRCAADPAAGGFAPAVPLAPLPAAGGTLAADAAGWPHWPADARAHLRAALQAGSGPVWSGSLAAEVWRVLAVGGLCLMPGAALPGPVVWAVAALMRAAGGVAEGPDGPARPGGGLIFGAAPAVARLRAARLPETADTDAALFGHRGLFRS